MIISIDPGTTKSGMVIILDDKVIKAVHLPNAEILEHIEAHDLVIIEWLVFYGRITGEAVFRTAQFCGEVKAVCLERNASYREMNRPDVCRSLVGRTRNISKAIVNQAVKDLYPQTGGGSTPAVGTKGQPGELYIFRATKGAGHAWDALALYHAWIREHENELEQYKKFINGRVTDASELW